MTLPFDRLLFDPRDIDLARSPLAGRLAADTHVLGAFNPGLARLPNGNLLMMVRVAEALRQPVVDGHVRVIRWDEGTYRLDEWPLARVVMDDPRAFGIAGQGWPVTALTSLSWLLPVELTPDGRGVAAVHYDRAIEPAAPWQCYGLEDPRISQVGDRYWMTVCAVSPERQSTALYSSPDGLDWRLDGMVLDHQNKDMLIFAGLIGGRYWAQTRPLGDAYFAYPPGSDWRAGPSINLATSPDGLHWKPHEKPGLRPRASVRTIRRMGGGAPPLPTPEGWLSLWHGVEPGGSVGIYRTYWSLLDRMEPWRVVRAGTEPVLTANPALTAPIADRMYVDQVVFTTGMVDGGDHYIVASGEADLACRISHLPKALFGL